MLAQSIDEIPLRGTWKGFKKCQHLTLDLLSGNFWGQGILSQLDQGQSEEQ